MTAVFGGEPYERLSRVFRRSCELAMPGAAFSLIRSTAPAEDGRPWDCRMNTRKLELWAEAAERHPSEALILADCDMLALGNAAPAFADSSFDIGYTRRSSILPLNGGILFVRPTRAARRWLRALVRVNEAMRGDPAFHGPFRARYHGMNQAAMGYLIEHPLAGVRVRAFPCRIWNAVGLEDWVAPDGAVFVHVKSSLRKVILGRQVSPQEARACATVAARWRAVEATL